MRVRNGKKHLVCFRSLFSQLVTQKYKNSKGKEEKQTIKRQENSINRRCNHFSGSTHSFGFFSSNSDTYLTPWTENCWLSGVLSRKRRDTGSANAAKARGQKWSGQKNQAEWRSKAPISRRQGVSFASSRERAARTRRGMREQLPERSSGTLSLIPNRHTGCCQENHLSSRGWAENWGRKRIKSFSGYMEPHAAGHALGSTAVLLPSTKAPLFKSLFK